MASETTAPTPSLFLVVDKDHVLEVDKDERPGIARSLIDDVDTAARAAGPLLAAFFGSSGRPCGPLYELSPESQSRLNSARLDEVGTYFRGVLRSPEGKTSHQVQLRRAERVEQPPSGLDVAMAAQLAAMQIQLDRIEEAVHAVGVDVKHVLTFLENQQRARVAACMAILDEVHGRAGQCGTLSETDWDRLSGVELDLETQREAVHAELMNRLQVDLRCSPSTGRKKLMDSVGPERIDELCELHRVLLIGLRKVNELTLLRRFQGGHLDDAIIASAVDKLRHLERQHLEVLASIRDTAKSGRKIAPRDKWARLWSDGLVVGARKDANNLREISAMSDRLERTATQGQPPKTIAGQVPLRVKGLPSPRPPDGERTGTPS